MGEPLDLLPCPFCGNETIKLFGDFWHNGDWIGESVHCWKCLSEMQAPRDTAQGPATARWNRRYPDYVAIQEAYENGLREAARIAEEIQCVSCETWFDASTGHYDEDCSKGRASCGDKRDREDIVRAIRAAALRRNSSILQK